MISRSSRIVGLLLLAACLPVSAQDFEEIGRVPLQASTVQEVAYLDQGDGFAIVGRRALGSRGYSLINLRDLSECFVSTAPELVQDIEVFEGRVYIGQEADNTTNGLQIVDFTDPSRCPPIRTGLQINNIPNGTNLKVRRWPSGTLYAVVTNGRWNNGCNAGERAVYFYNVVTNNVDAVWSMGQDGFQPGCTAGCDPCGTSFADRLFRAFVERPVSNPGRCKQLQWLRNT